MLATPLVIAPTTRHAGRHELFGFLRQSHGGLADNHRHAPADSPSSNQSQCGQTRGRRPGHRGGQLGARKEDDPNVSVWPETNGSGQLTDRPDASRHWPRTYCWRNSDSVRVNQHPRAAVQGLSKGPSVCELLDGHWRSVRRGPSPLASSRFSDNSTIPFHSVRWAPHPCTLS